MKKDVALNWILNNIDIHEFKDDESTELEMVDWYAYEMSQFSSIEPNKPMIDFINDNYKVKTFFEDHEKVANRYYGC